MVSQDWIIFTEAQRDAALAHGETTDFKVDPRLIDNGPAELLGQYAAPAHLLNNLEYAPVWGKVLEGYPTIRARASALFLPSTD